MRLRLLLQDLAGGGGRGLDPQESCPLTFEFVPTGLFELDLALLVRQQSKKAPLRCVKSVCAGNTKKEKLLI